MVETLMMTWIRDIWDSIIIPEGKKKFLVYDKFNVYAKATVLQTLNEIDSEVRIILAGCTRILQPLDTDVNKSFNNKLRNKFDTWFSQFATEQ